MLYVPVGSQRCSCGLCSGELRPTLPSAVFRKQLVVFRNIAGFHGFELLEQLADWLLGSTQERCQAWRRLQRCRASGW